MGQYTEEGLDREVGKQLRLLLSQSLKKKNPNTEMSSLKMMENILAFLSSTHTKREALNCFIQWMSFMPSFNELEQAMMIEEQEMSPQQSQNTAILLRAHFKIQEMMRELNRNSSMILHDSRYYYRIKEKLERTLDWMSCHEPFFQEPDWPIGDESDDDEAVDELTTDQESIDEEDADEDEDQVDLDDIEVEFIPNERHYLNPITIRRFYLPSTSTNSSASNSISE